MTGWLKKENITDRKNISLERRRRTELIWFTPTSYRYTSKQKICFGILEFYIQFRYPKDCCKYSWKCHSDSIKACSDTIKTINFTRVKHLSVVEVIYAFLSNISVLHERDVLMSIFAAHKERSLFISNRPRNIMEKYPTQVFSIRTWII